MRANIEEKKKEIHEKFQNIKRKDGLYALEVYSCMGDYGYEFCTSNVVFNWYGRAYRKDTFRIEERDIELEI
ncbi:hypothetical protein COM53_27260 [Bacillus toyonensis]|uniref:hypothetical protein n=1 Tax=Bacillus toyonensis TaxID=155322 RepID=UPI000BF967C7|nr:hypothetical protein COM53_27260 [Bacillus toyonensis]